MKDVVLAKVEKFFGAYRLRKYNKGQVLLLNGDTGGNVFYLIEGKVKQYDVTYRGDEIILNIFKPPAFFPMSLAINKTENPYIYEADTDVVLRQVPMPEVVAFIKSNPDVLFDLLSRVYKGMDGILGRVVQLMTGSAKGRLMYELLIEARRFGTEAGKSMVLDVSEKELGARAGLSRETVSREASKLVSENLLTIHGGKVTIIDITAFEQKLGRVI